MKNILFTLVLLISFASFVQDDVKQGEWSGYKWKKTTQNFSSADAKP